MPKRTTDAAPDITLDWDDLRFVLAVAEGGSLNAGAARLGVRHSTVLRRLDALEARLGARLFERRRQGYAPTDAGSLMVEQAAQMQPAIAALQRRILGRDLQLSGPVRLNCPHFAVQGLLPQALADFAKSQPGIQVELAQSSGLVDLSRRDADVALRLSAQVPDHWVGRALGEVRFRVYTRRLTGGRAPALQGLDSLRHTARWIGFEQGLDRRFFERWMNQQVPAAQVVFRVDQFNAMVALLRTGLGVGLLPEVLGRQATDLAPISEPITALTTPLWLLTHPDLRRTARITALVQHLAQALPPLLAAG